MKWRTIFMVFILPLSAFFCFAGTNKTSNYEGEIVVDEANVSSGLSVFNARSPWNSLIYQPVHDSSQNIVDYMSSKASNIRFGNSFLPPIWIVDYDKISHYPVRSTYPFNIWDVNHDFIVDISIPMDTSFWAEQTNDGHIILIDTTYQMAWEMSRFKGIINDTVRCSTFNVWDLKGLGVGQPNEGLRWNQRGGRGSGFPIIAGLIRPEEILNGEIKHPLVFTFDKVKEGIFYSPACRLDGFVPDIDAPAEGMLFQLNPELTEADFTTMGLSNSAKLVAVALQKYGMYLCDSGGDMALQLQLLDKDISKHREKWDKLATGLYQTIQKIPTAEFQLLKTPVVESYGKMNRVTTPLIQPVCGNYPDSLIVKMECDKMWPNAEIRYTLDGSLPLSSSHLYGNPIVLHTSGMVRARAFDPKGQESPVMRAEFVISKTI